MSDERQSVTYEEAAHMIGDRERVHTFRNSVAGLMLGADWDRKSVLRAIEKHGVELSGPMATNMRRGLVLFDDRGPLFIETVNGRLSEAGELVGVTV